MLIGLVFWVYSSALDGPFLLDSVKLYPWLSAWEQHTDCTRTLASLDSPRRAFSWLTFCWNFAYADGLNVYQIKWVNLLLHLICSVVVWRVTTRILHLLQVPAAASIGMWVMAFWALAPVHVSTVLYGIQRMTLLATVCVFVALYAYMKFRFPAQKTGLVGRRGWLVVACVAGALGVLAKEIAVLLPLYVYLLEWAVFIARRESAGSPEDTRLQGMNGALRVEPPVPCAFRRGVQLTLIAGTLVALLYLGLGYASYDQVYFSFTERVLSQFRIIWLYVGQILLPHDGSPGIFFDGYVPSTGWLEPATTLAGTMALLLLLALLKKAHAVVAFGVGFFLISHLLESTVLPLELVFLHRNYAGAVGVFLASVFLLHRYLPRYLFVALALCMLLGFTLVSLWKVQAWESEEQALSVAYSYHPDSVRAAQHYAAVLTQYGQHIPALEVLASVEPHTAAKRVTVTLQTLYLHCLLARPVDAEQYQVLDALGQTQGHEIEVNQGLENIRSVLEAGCQVLDVEKVSASLRQAAQQVAPADRWNFTYYDAMLQQAAGHPEAALAVLENAMLSGEPRALLVALEWLIQENRHCEAYQLLAAMPADLLNQPVLHEYLPEFERIIAAGCPR